MSARPALLAATLLALLATGCATQRPAAPVVPGADTATLGHFSLTGKAGYRVGARGGSASLAWQQAGSHYDIVVSGPLGAGSARIRGDDSAVLVESGRDSRWSDQPAALLAEVLGWPVPVSALAYWVRGLPSPLSPAETEKDAAGDSLLIRQDGWEIRLDRYTAAGPWRLPGRIIATGGDSRLTLAIERWDTGGGGPP